MNYLVADVKYYYDVHTPDLSDQNDDAKVIELSFNTMEILNLSMDKSRQQFVLMIIRM